MVFDIATTGCADFADHYRIYYYCNIIMYYLIYNVKSPIHPIGIFDYIKWKVIDAHRKEVLNRLRSALRSKILILEPPLPN